MQAILDYFPPNTKMTQPRGGYVLWIELDKNIDAFKLYQEAVAKNISIAPGQIFSTDSRFTHFIRISFGISFDETVDKSIRVLGNLIKAKAKAKA
jgi:DNA-binding transcriptional MocR family regulator